MSPSTPASAAATAAAATAMLERATDGGRYGPSSYIYAGSRPSRYDFGSMWAGEQKVARTKPYTCALIYTHGLLHCTACFV